MPDTTHGADNTAPVVSPYYLSAASRELLKQRSADIRENLQRRREERDWPQVEPHAPAGLLAWPRTLLAAACVFTTLTAAASEWQHAAETPEGTTWMWRQGTAAREQVLGRQARTVVVQRNAAGGQWLYKAAAFDETCTERHGEVHLLTMNHQMVETTKFTRGDRSVAAAMALVLCSNAPGPQK